MDSLKFELIKATEEAPFVLNTTKNVFSKRYSDEVTSMLHWTEEDAKRYWIDMKEVLSCYFKELDKELEKAYERSDENE